MGKRKTIFGLVLIVGPCMLVCIGPVVYQSIRLEYYHHTWKPPQNYEITFWAWQGQTGGEYKFHVCDGQVADATGYVCILYPELCSGDVVEGLFSLAKDKRWTLNTIETKYNKRYGFPDTIISGSIDRFGVNVTDFQILDSCEGQPASTAP